MFAKSSVFKLHKSYAPKNKPQLTLEALSASRHQCCLRIYTFMRPLSVGVTLSHPLPPPFFLIVVGGNMECAVHINGRQYITHYTC